MQIRSGTVPLSLIVVIFGGLISCAFQVSQSSSPVMSAEQQVELRQFAGTWDLGSASFQLSGGRVTYTFENGRLTVVHHAGGTDKNGDPRLVEERTERFRCRLDMNRDPKQLFLSPSDEHDPKEEKWIYEFRNGWLWMCRDDGPAPKGHSSLRPGDCSWLIGLQRATRGKPAG